MHGYHIHQPCVFSPFAMSISSVLSNTESQTVDGVLGVLDMPASGSLVAG